MCYAFDADRSVSKRVSEGIPMPLQRYNKAHILDACLAVFARHGYEKTSTVMLAEAAGISRALIFHHFKSKKELYLSLLDHWFEEARRLFDVDTLLASQDFFASRELLSLSKFALKKRHPDVYIVMKEAFFATPEEVKTEIRERLQAFTALRNDLWRQVFEQVVLKEGVDREQAFELLTLTMDYFDEKYLSSMTDESDLDEADARRFLEERKRFLALIRYGIEQEAQGTNDRPSV
jgi:TetR/AcrR family transcriptional regulator